MHEDVTEYTCRGPESRPLACVSDLVSVRGQAACLSFLAADRIVCRVPLDRVELSEVSIRSVGERVRWSPHSEPSCSRRPRSTSTSTDWCTAVVEVR